MKNILFPFNQDNKDLNEKLEKKWWHRLFVVFYSIIILVFPIILWASLWSDFSFSGFTGVNNGIVFVILFLSALLSDYLLFLLIQFIYYNIFIYVIYGNDNFFKKDLGILFKFLGAILILAIINGLLYFSIYSYEIKKCEEHERGFTFDYFQGCFKNNFDNFHYLK